MHATGYQAFYQGMQAGRVESFSIEQRGDDRGYDAAERYGMGSDGRLPGLRLYTTVDILYTEKSGGRLSYTNAVKKGRVSSTLRGDKSIREKAYILIQQKILRGELPPGGAVSEIALSQELGSSRTPVREALGQLAAEGLLEQTQNRGAVVIQLKRQDIIDLYELREALEVYAIGKVASRGNSDHQLDRLRALAMQIADMRDKLERSRQTELNEKQMQQFIACDLGFHLSLVRMASNSRILKLLNETRLLIRIFSIHRHGHDVPALARIHQQHSDMLRAVSDLDPERAMRILADHIQASLQERLDEFDRWEHEASMRETLPVFFDVHPAGELL